MINLIEYVAGHSDNGVPGLYKQYSDNDKVLMRSALMPSNLEELSNVSDEVIYTHINNMIEYMKVLSVDMHIIPSGSNPRDGWPVVGWSEIYRINILTTEWWNYVEFREVQGILPMATIGHSH